MAEMHLPADVAAELDRRAALYDIDPVDVLRGLLWPVRDSEEATMYGTLDFP